jgi:hypothetical protein
VQCGLATAEITAKLPTGAAYGCGVWTRGEERTQYVRRRKEEEEERRHSRSSSKQNEREQERTLGQSGQTEEELASNKYTQSQNTHHSEHTCDIHQLTDTRLKRS